MPKGTSSTGWFTRLKRGWREFKAAPVGRRFQQLYERRKQVRQSPWRKALFMAVGLLTMLAGLVLLFIPGPGLLVLFAGAALVARESLWFCRLLDWAEQKSQPLIKPCLALWRKLPWTAKTLFALAAVALRH